MGKVGREPGQLLLMMTGEPSLNAPERGMHHSGELGGGQSCVILRRTRLGASGEPGDRIF